MERGIILESTPISAKPTTPPKGATSPVMTQAESAPPVTPPPIISASDPFPNLSWAINDGSSLVVTPSLIPTSTTQGPDADLSPDEGSEGILKDSDDESVMKTRVSDSN